MPVRLPPGLPYLLSAGPVWRSGRVEGAPALNEIFIIVKPSVPLVRIWLKNPSTFTKLLTVRGRWGIFPARLPTELATVFCHRKEHRRSLFFATLHPHTPQLPCMFPPFKNGMQLVSLSALYYPAVVAVTLPDNTIVFLIGAIPGIISVQQKRRWQSVGANRERPREHKTFRGQLPR